MDGEIDFDPLSAEGREDINDIDDDEYEYILPKDDETQQGWYDRVHSSYGPNTNSLISRVRNLFKIKNPHSSVPPYLQMREDYQTDYRTLRYEMTDEIISGLREKRPNLDLSLLDFKVNEKGRAMVKYTTGKKWYFLYNSKTGDFLKYLPKNIKDALGDPPLREQKEVLEEREEIEMKELKEAREDAILDAVAGNDPELVFARNYIRDLVALKKDSKNQVFRLLKRVINLRIEETKDAVKTIMQEFVNKLQNMSEESKKRVNEFFKLTQRKSKFEEIVEKASQRAQEKYMKNKEWEEETRNRFEKIVERAAEQDKRLRKEAEEAKKFVDGLANLSKEGKQKIIVFMKNVERAGGEEGKEAIIEDKVNGLNPGAAVGS